MLRVVIALPFHTTEAEPPRIGYYRECRTPNPEASSFKMSSNFPKKHQAIFDWLQYYSFCNWRRLVGYGNKLKMALRDEIDDAFDSVVFLEERFNPLWSNIMNLETIKSWLFFPLGFTKRALRKATRLGKRKDFQKVDSWAFRKAVILVARFVLMWCRWIRWPLLISPLRRKLG